MLISNSSHARYAHLGPDIDSHQSAGELRPKYEYSRGTSFSYLARKKPQRSHVTWQAPKAAPRSPCLHGNFKRPRPFCSSSCYSQIRGVFWRMFEPSGTNLLTEEKRAWCLSSTVPGTWTRPWHRQSPHPSLAATTACNEDVRHMQSPKPWL